MPGVINFQYSTLFIATITLVLIQEKGKKIKDQKDSPVNIVMHTTKDLLFPRISHLLTIFFSTVLLPLFFICFEYDESYIFTPGQKSISTFDCEKGTDYLYRNIYPFLLIEYI